MDNPLIIEGNGTETNPWADTDIDNLDSYAKFEKMFNDLMYQDPQMWDERVYEPIYGGFETQKVQLRFSNFSEKKQREIIKGIIDKLKAQGYDGIIIKNTRVDSLNPDEGINQYVVFEPNQIKSVYNRGAFDQNIDNIYYQGGERQNDLIKRTDKGKYLTDDEVLAVDKDAKDFAIKIAALEKGELPKREQLIVLNRLPSAYNDIKELKGRKLLITQDVYKKIIDIPNKFNKNHSVARNRAVKLPELAADPNYILQSKAKDHENRFVIVTKSRGKRPGERLSIIVQPGQNAAVVSGYDENINISKEKKAGRVLFGKKKELETKSTTLNVVDDSNSYASNIALKEGNVKPDYQNKPQPKGLYDASKGGIKIFESADFSTLPHEIAHYWLDNMWSYVRSGNASEKYCQRWNVIAKGQGLSIWSGLLD